MLMRRDETLLEPFAPEVLAAIRAAFRAGWEELMAGGRAADPILRNKLAGAIANLARSGIRDADELKRNALLRLNPGQPHRVKREPAPAGAGSTAAAAAHRQRAEHDRPLAASCTM